MLPRIYGENLFDDIFDDSFFTGHDPLFGKNGRNLMKTDVRETDDAKSYRLSIDLPGFKKDEITVEVKNGCLNISAAKGLDKEEKDKDGKYIRQERYAGSCSRSFYIGNEVDPAAVTAKFENGILQISVPKASRQLPAKSTVEIK